MGRGSTGRCGSLLQLQPYAQQLGNAPRLRDAAARRERLFSVEYFTDRSDATIVEVRPKSLDRMSR